MAASLAPEFRRTGVNRTGPRRTMRGAAPAAPWGSRHPPPTRKAPTVTSKTVQTLDRVVIRFAGDSGDGMQLTGDRFTSDTAAVGNDLSTLPNFPAEIRAPQGTLPGVNSFQLHFADHDVLTPGDAPDVLVAMNPVALTSITVEALAGFDTLSRKDKERANNMFALGLLSWMYHRPTTGTELFL